MAIKNLKAEKQEAQYFFRYTLDDSKTVTAEDGTTSPDPKTIREFSYAPQPPEGMKEADYQTMMKNEMLLLMEAELNQPTPQAPTPLTGF